MDRQRAAFILPRSSAQVLLEVTSLVRTHRVKVTAARPTLTLTLILILTLTLTLTLTPTLTLTLTLTLSVTEPPPGC